MVIYQGGKEIDEDDFRSHVYSLCQLDNIGVLLGAGASAGCGGHTMKEVWQAFKKEHPELLVLLIEKYLLVSQNDSNEDKVNVELLIDEATKFLSVARTRRNAKEEKEVNSILSALYKTVTKAALLTGDDFRNKNQGKKKQFSYHKELISKLISNRQPGQSAPALFTTNYDLALEWAAEDLGIQLFNGFSGLHTRQFYPQNFDLAFRNVNAKGEARFGHYHAYLYKLHGSLTWYQEDNLTVNEISSTQAYDNYIKNIINENEYYFGQHLIYPGANKYSHTIGFVYGEMFRRFGEFLSKPQTALFINGFGFGDYHINRIVLGALLNPSFHVVVYYPALTTAMNNVERGEGAENEKAIVNLKNMAFNQITVVGGGEDAYFDSFVKHLPYPVLFPRGNTVDDLVEAISNLSKGDKNVPF
ncbi:SIR2 family anti-phage-associated protein [Serratia ureilytica]|uniref:SIR2 family anti-phage-associated protein n=1 Tax=Serratia ureilytica TaxID=300181 RepID=UPI0018D6B687|nr:SIR2 family anti-phage-associated protein [Serratia ureilytica]MBH3021983.1 SIR2 family protein [Serratia ureilytica]